VDGQQFDSWTRRFFVRFSRRSLGKFVAVGMIGSLPIISVQNEVGAKSCPRAGRCDPGFPVCAKRKRRFPCVCAKQFSNGQNVCVKTRSVPCAPNVDCANCPRGTVCVVNACGCRGGGLACVKKC